MPCSSHTRLHHSNYIWRILQVMKILILQFSPTSYNLVPRWEIIRIAVEIRHRILSTQRTIVVPFTIKSQERLGRKV
jgi:hypothetical protein